MKFDTPARLAPRRAGAPSRHGFTLVEIMIVVLIIGVLLSIAAPAFVYSRDKGRARACVYNLKEISTAKEEYALDNNLSNGTAVTWTNVSRYIRGPQPTCPANLPGQNQYVLGPVGASATCPYGAPATDPTLVHVYNF